MSDLILNNTKLFIGTSGKLLRARQIKTYYDLVIAEPSGSHWQSYAGDTLILGQGFVVPDCYLDSIILPSASDMNSPDFNTRISIYNSSAGLPTTKIVDSANVLTAYEITDWPNPAIFNFNDFYLSAGTYQFVMSWEDVILNDTDNNVNFEINNTNPYADGTLTYKIGAGSWESLSGYDICSTIRYYV